MKLSSNAPIVIAALATTFLAACDGKESAESPLEGAWSVVSIRVAGSDSAANTMVQPSVYLFGEKHYSMMRATGNQPRALAAKDSVTAAEKIAAYDSFVANSGTYEVADSTVTVHPVVARSPNFMAGGSDKFHFRVAGDTLWLSNTGTEFMTMSGGRLATPAGTRSATMLVLIRQK